ncbi:MAG: alpha/beta fold hydrolase [Longimicrobiales bacterium]
MGRAAPLGAAGLERLGLAAGVLLFGEAALAAADTSARPPDSQLLPRDGRCEASVASMQEEGATPKPLPPAEGRHAEGARNRPGASAVQFRWAPLGTGVLIRFVERGPQDGEPIILLHGYTDSWFSWSRVLPLMPSGYRVFAIDQRGHGCSARPETGYRMTDLAADVIAFMDAQDLPRATIVGHSMGSLVAQYVALAAPERVTRLVLVASAAAPSRVQGIVEFGDAVHGLSEPIPVDFVREFQLSTVHHPVPSEFIDGVVAESMKLPARVWRALFEGMLAMQPATELRGLRIPTLILWGEEDAVFPRSEQDALLSTSPHARFVVYPETGHAPHWERPERFVQDLERFLQTPAGT